MQLKLINHIILLNESNFVIRFFLFLVSIAMSIPKSTVARLNFLSCWTIVTRVFTSKTISWNVWCKPITPPYSDWNFYHSNI